MRIVHHLHQTQDIYFIYSDPWRAKDVPRRIVWMNCHIDIVLIADWHNAFKEIFQVSKHLFHVKRVYSLLCIS